MDRSGAFDAGLLQGFQRLGDAGKMQKMVISVALIG
jgi:hypothetical protein